MADRNINEIVDVLAAADPRHGNHRQALERVTQLQQNPAFFSCCSNIFSSAQFTGFVRMQAGLQIKNNIMNQMCIQNPEVRDRLIPSVGDAEASIRKIACAVISAAVRNGAWDIGYVVPQLVAMIQAAGVTNPGQVHGCVLALSQIVEDAVQLVDAKGLSAAVIQALCPCVMYEGNEKIRLNALIGLSVFLEQAGVDQAGASYAALKPCVLPLIDCFFNNLQTPMSTDISEKAIKCLVLSLTFYDQIDSTLFMRMAQLMLQATQVDPNTMESVRIEATEFWRAVLYFPQFAECVFNAMSQIVPLLVDGMVYSKMELGMLQANEKDANVPDRPEDIKPKHYEGRTQSTADDDEDDDDDEEVEEWNLRRVSASTLDDIAEYFGDRILDSVLCVIDQRMQPSNDWRILEAAILALGAISEGCFEGLKPYLDVISDRLLTILETPATHFLVVSITTWTVRRLAQYLMLAFDANGRLTKLMRYVACLLVHMKSESKVVQEAACSALTDICGQADDHQLDECLLPIASTVNVCLGAYQLKNRILLFELIEALCAMFGNRIAEGDVMGLFINPLVAIWQQTPNDSPLLFSFFVCMSSVCQALGPHIQPMAKDIFDRGFGMLHYHMSARQAALAAQGEPPEFEFIVTSIDLLSGLFDALGSSLEPLVQANQPTFVQLTLAAVVDENHEIRQSGFGLFGDLAKACPRYVQECLPQLLQAVIQNCQNLDEFTSGCISNAAYCLQQLLEHQMDIDGLPTLNAQNMPVVLTQFLKILASGTLSADMKNMAENIVLLVGNMMHSNPEVLHASGISIDLFFASWLHYARNIRKVESRQNAARGVLLALQASPASLVPSLNVFFDYANSLTNCQGDIHKAISHILAQVKAGAPADFARAVQAYSPPLMQKLFVAYGVQ